MCAHVMIPDPMEPLFVSISRLQCVPVEFKFSVPMHTAQPFIITSGKELVGKSDGASNAWLPSPVKFDA